MHDKLIRIHYHYYALRVNRHLLHTCKNTICKGSNQPTNVLLIVIYYLQTTIIIIIITTTTIIVIVMLSTDTLDDREPAINKIRYGWWHEKSEKYHCCIPKIATISTKYYYLPTNQTHTFVTQT